MSKLTHLDALGNAHMVDVSDKAVTSRSATARARVLMLPETVSLITSGTAKKGDVLATARLAGIMAAKKTSDLIPLCHPLMISKVSVEFSIGENLIDVEASLLEEALKEVTQRFQNPVPGDRAPRKRTDAS